MSMLYTIYKILKSEIAMAQIQKYKKKIDQLKSIQNKTKIPIPKQ